MTENEATREMTFEEEYPILQKEKEELFAMENCDSEPPFANSVVRRASRCIRKLLEEIQQYRAIGTVEDMQQKDEVIATQTDIINGVYKDYEKYLKIGTIDEFKDLKEKSAAKKVIRWADGSEHCPCCDFDNSAIGYSVCIDCGQKLDWSE